MLSYPVVPWETVLPNRHSILICDPINPVTSPNSIKVLFTSPFILQFVYANPLQLIIPSYGVVIFSCLFITYKYYIIYKSILK